jgi:hypothetical protein
MTTGVEPGMGEAWADGFGTAPPFVSAEEGREDEQAALKNKKHKRSGKLLIFFITNQNFLHAVLMWRKSPPFQKNLI